MIRVRLKIGTGEGDPVYTDTAYGLIYLDSDKRTGSPVKSYETTSYPEEEGEHILPKTVDDAFDYKVKFFINPVHQGGNPVTIQNANTTITAFNDLILPLDQETGQRTVNQVTFYNDYKRHKIVGYPQPIAEATEFWRDKRSQVNDIVVVEWTIRVTKPSLCDFNLSEV